MSKKPSMFSKNYRKKLRKRRIRYISIIGGVILIIGIGAVMIYSKGTISTLGEAFNKKPGNEVVDQVPEDTATEKDTQAEIEEKEKQEKANQLETEEIQLESGKKVKITYKKVEDKKKFQMVEGDLEVNTSLSPTQETLLICDRSSKDIYILGSTGELKKITNPKYVATTNEVFTKESVMTRNPEYKWIENAQFIDDTHVAYSSALPWINNEGNLYLWIFDTTTQTHKVYYDFKGKSFEFGEITEKGLTITVDSNTKIVNNQGKLVQ